MEPEHPSSHCESFFFLSLLLLLPSYALTLCRNKCGSLDVRYPFGTGFGCGSPRFFPSISCSTDDSDNNNNSEVLTLTTHTGTYPITSISYQTSTLTISPPLMSTCSDMHPSAPGLGLDWAAPFQLGPSLFVLLACPSTTSSQPYCDSSPYGLRLCAALNACPALPALGLPLFAPANTCCAYSPASLGPKGELDVRQLGCSAYSSVLSFWTIPTDPATWEYGVALKYGLEEEAVVAEVCQLCEGSGGACGFAPPRNYFVCVCASGVNTSTNCAGQDGEERTYLRSSAEHFVDVMYSLRLMAVLVGSWLVFM